MPTIRKKFELIRDISPQLGGDLDMNGYNVGGNTEAQIDDAVAKKHSQNTDTALGPQSENLDMNTHKIVGVVDPTTDQEAATKKYVDDNVGGTLDDAYDKQPGIARVINIDDFPIDMRLSDNKEFKITRKFMAGADTTFKVSTGISRSCSIYGEYIQDLKIVAGDPANPFKHELGWSGSAAFFRVHNGGFNGSLVIDADILSFRDKNLGVTINISETGVSGLSGFTAISIVGALNECRGDIITNHNSLSGLEGGATDNYVHAHSIGTNNISLGNEAGVNITGSGSRGVNLGVRAGYLLEAGSCYVNIGYEAGYSCVNGSNNVNIGFQAGKNSTRFRNVFIGYKAGQSNINGDDNIFIGNEAGINELGSDKLYIDSSSTSSPLIYGDFSTNELKINGALEVTGKLTVGGLIDPTGLSFTPQVANPLGTLKGLWIDSADDTLHYFDGTVDITLEASINNHNDLSGLQGGAANSYIHAHGIGTNNISLGEGTGVSNAGGSQGVNIGEQAGHSLWEGRRNVNVGYEAGYANVMGEENVSIGYQAGRNNTNRNSVYIGAGAGKNNLTGRGNVFIGHQVGYNETTSDKLYVANSLTTTPLIYGEFDTPLLRFHTDDIEIGASIKHIGDINNLIVFGIDTQDYQTGGSSRFDISDVGVRLGGANSRVTTILDEDDMASDSNTALATQQSIKAYRDALHKLSTDVSSATPIPIGSGKFNKYTLTALAVAPTFAVPSGTPADGNKLIIRIKDNGTARAITWNAIYREGSDVTKPTTTTISKTVYCGFIYNSADSKWDLVAVTGAI